MNESYIKEMYKYLDEICEEDDDYAINPFFLGVLIAVTLCFVVFFVYVYIYYVTTSTNFVDKAIGDKIKAIEEHHIYKESVKLMSEGAYDTREYYVVEDEDYMQWRIQNQPIRGAEYDTEVLIPVVGTNDLAVGYIRQCVSYIPEFFVKKMAEDGWTIRVTNGQDGLYSEYAGIGDNVEVLGNANYEDKLITVNMEKPFTVYHEIGHVVAHYAEEEISEAGLDSFSNDGELSKLCCHSASGSVYVYMNPDEQIAESFFDYIWYPREMQEQAPTLYRIIDGVVNGG